MAIGKQQCFNIHVHIMSRQVVFFFLCLFLFLCLSFGSCSSGACAYASAPSSSIFKRETVMDAPRDEDVGNSAGGLGWETVERLLGVFCLVVWLVGWLVGFGLVSLGLV